MAGPGRGAQTRALAPAPVSGGPALAGGRVFWASPSGETLQVRSAPVEGGAQTLVATVPFARPAAAWALAASAEGLALRGPLGRLYAGGLDGPLTEWARSLSAGRRWPMLRGCG